MAVEKLVSAKRIISRVIRDFKPSDRAWIADVYEWIADTLEFIGVPDLFEYDEQNLFITNGRAILPVIAEGVEYIIYNGLRLRNVNNKRINPKCGCDLRCDSVNNYRLDGKFVKTSFERGKITVVYRKARVDDCGIPLVPSNVVFQDACAWYIMMKLLGLGYTHPVYNIKDATINWDNKMYAARNDLADFTEDAEENFRAIWTNFDLRESVIDSFYAF